MASSAPVTETADIRNVVVFGHGGCGKTSLVDSMCYVAGNTNRKGDIDKGSALTDFTAEEIAHKISINLGVAHARWKVNLIDTPGYLDFFGEVMAGMRVADSGLCVIDAVHGVEVGTERTWAAADFQGLPRMIFVSLMDRDNANFQKTFQQILKTLTAAAIPVQVPIGSGKNFKGIVNLLSMKAHLFKGGDKGNYEETDIPEELMSDVETFREQLIEAIVAADDELLELRIFIDKSSVEVFANNRRYMTVRVHPSREDSLGVRLRAQGSDAILVSLDAWQMKNIWAKE